MSMIKFSEHTHTHNCSHTLLKISRITLFEMWMLQNPPPLKEGKQYSESIEFLRSMDYLAMICKVDIEDKGD